MKKRLIITALCITVIYLLFKAPYYELTGMSNVESSDQVPLVIKEDGTLLSWGWNSGGQVGVGTTEDVLVLTPVLDDVVYADGGNNVNFGLKEDGTLWGWGVNYYGQVGNGTFEEVLSPVKILEDVKSFDACYETTYAIKNDNTLWGWGVTVNGLKADRKFLRPYEYVNTPVKIMDDVKSVHNFGNVVYVIKNDNTLWGWGANYYGELGMGSDRNIKKPVKILDDVKYVRLKERTAFAIQNDGSLWTWGSNRFHLGDEYILYKPTKVDENVEKIDIGVFEMFYLKTDGTMWSLGYGDNGRNEEDYEKLEPVKILENVSDFQTGNNNHTTFVIKDDKSLWGWGGSIGDNTPTKIMDNVTFASCEYSTNYVIKEDKTLWSWGYNNEGQVGNGTAEYVAEPVQVLENVEYVSDGLWQSGAVTSDGSLWMFGNDHNREVVNTTGFPLKVADGISTERPEDVKFVKHLDIYFSEADSKYYKKYLGIILIVGVFVNWGKYFKRVKQEKKL